MADGLARLAVGPSENGPAMFDRPTPVCPEAAQADLIDDAHHLDADANSNQSSWMALTETCLSFSDSAGILDFSPSAFCKRRCMV